MSELEGKIVWPIPEKGVDLKEAYATLYDIADGKIMLTEYAENGDDLTGNLAIDLIGSLYSSGGPENYFFRPLKDALEEKLRRFDAAGIAPDILSEIAVDEEEAEVWQDEKDHTLLTEKSRRLTVRLLRAFLEWEENEATYTLAELRTRPLPPFKAPDSEDVIERLRAENARLRKRLEDRPTRPHPIDQLNNLSSAMWGDAEKEVTEQAALIAELAARLREARAFLYQNCGFTDDIIARIDALLQ